MAERRPANLLEIRGLNVYYGRSHALQGVDLTLAHGVLSLVGRNGMGKTTLCKAIVGLTPAATGSIRFMGEELIGRTPAEISDADIPPTNPAGPGIFTSRSTGDVGPAVPAGTVFGLAQISSVPSRSRPALRLLIQIDPHIGAHLNGEADGFSDRFSPLYRGGLLARPGVVVTHRLSDLGQVLFPGGRDNNG